MKNLFVIVAIAATFSLNACAQTGKEVPAKVKATFSQKFPDAKKIKWDKENDNEWEAEFKMNGNEYSANFSSDGTWKETEHEIEKAEIPPMVQGTLDSKFAGYDIEEAEVSETPEGKVFEIQMEKDESDMEVAIAPDGSIVKKEGKKEHDEGDGENDND
ncbi:MAG: hypothetical protein GXO89_04145 [Chlorobi bacterium]|nr:hypothetical protein [Chlorobiota bacterium]